MTLTPQTTLINHHLPVINSNVEARARDEIIHRQADWELRLIMTEHTTAKLAKALSTIPGMPKQMVAQAIDGYYHDYLSPLAMPANQLVADLREAAALPATPHDSRPMMRSLADRVIAGDFDATKEEADAWAASPEGQATFRELMLGDI